MTLYNSNTCSNGKYIQQRPKQELLTVFFRRPPGVDGSFLMHTFSTLQHTNIKPFVTQKESNPRLQPPVAILRVQESLIIWRPYWEPWVRARVLAGASPIRFDISIFTAYHSFYSRLELGIYVLSIHTYIHLALVGAYLPTHIHRGIRNIISLAQGVALFVFIDRRPPTWPLHN